MVLMECFRFAKCVPIHFSQIQLETELNNKQCLKLLAVLHNSPSTGVFCHNLSRISLKGWDIYEKLLFLLKKKMSCFLRSPPPGIFRCPSPYPNGLCWSTCCWWCREQLAKSGKCKNLMVTRSYYCMPL